MVNQTSKTKGSEENPPPKKKVWGTGINSWAEHAQIIHWGEEGKEKRETRLGGMGVWLG